MPLPLETYIAYGEAFQERFVPGVERKLLVALEPTSSGFRATFDDGEVVMARHIVLAVGVHPFKHVPRILNHLPAEFRSHSGDYGSLDAFGGREVIVLGSGASAIDVAALAHERGASVRLVARASELRFAHSSRGTKIIIETAGVPIARPSPSGFWHWRYLASKSLRRCALAYSCLARAISPPSCAHHARSARTSLDEGSSGR